MMPINQQITYSYRPSCPPSVKPFMPTYESYRARAEIGGTFIRAIEPGAAGNQVSVEFITSGSDVTMIVKGPLRIPAPTYIGTGTGVVSNIDVPQVPVYETITVAATTPTTFSVVGSISGSIGIATVDQQFTTQIVSFTIIHGDVDFTAGDTFTITIQDPTEIYQATNNIDQNPPLAEPPPDPLPAVIPSPSYAQLRLAVNGISKHIHMPERGWDYVDGLGTDPKTGRSVRAAGTTAQDLAVVPPAPRTYLSGGAGFPSTPAGVYTGTSRTLIHINRGENDNGSVLEVNKVYEWNGSSAFSGSFTVYV